MKRSGIFLVSLVVLLGAILVLGVFRVTINGFSVYDGDDLAFRGIAGDNIWDDVQKFFGFTGEEQGGQVALSSPSGCTIFVDKNIAPSPCTTYNEATRSCTGGSERAYKTLTGAANVAVAVDVVCARAGTYAETLSPVNSGTVNNKITFKAYPGEECQGTMGKTKVPGSCKVIISGQENGADLGGRNHIRIEGFEIKDHDGAGIYNMIVWGATSYQTNGNQFVNNYIHNNNGDGIDSENSDNTLVENNEIFDNLDTAVRFGGQLSSRGLIGRGNNIHYNGKDGFQGGCTNCLFEFNEMYDQIHTEQHQDGFDLGDLENVTIRYNIVSDFTQLIYITSATDTIIHVDGLDIYGNIIYVDKYWTVKNADTPGIYLDANKAGALIENVNIHSNICGWLGGVQCVRIYGNVRNLKIRNNIFKDSVNNVEIDNMLQLSSDYNIYWGDRFGAPVNIPTYDGSHSQRIDPLFVNDLKIPRRVKSFTKDISSATLGEVNGKTTLTKASENFETLKVQPGYRVDITAGGNKLTCYTGNYDDCERLSVESVSGNIITLTGDVTAVGGNVDFTVWYYPPTLNEIYLDDISNFVVGDFIEAYDGVVRSVTSIGSDSYGAKITLTPSFAEHISGYSRGIFNWKQSSNFKPDYHVNPSSPAIDAGANIQQIYGLINMKDFDGNSRPLDGPDADTIAQYDIGAYEYTSGQSGCTTNAECNDNIACTTDTCNSGTCSHALQNNLCSNGLFCDGAETCSGTQGCIAGTAPCTDAVSCTTNSCNEATDSCGIAFNHDSCPSDPNCLVEQCTANGCDYSDCTTPLALELHYKFDDVTSDGVLDSSPNVRHGSCGANCPALTADRNGNTNAAYLFDGTNDRVDYATTLNAGSSFSVSGWINPATSTNGKWHNIFADSTGSAWAGTDFGALYLHNGKLDYWYDDDTLVGDVGSIPLNAWSFITLTAGNGNVKIYVNGVMVGSGNANPVFNNAFYIARKDGGGDDLFFNGTMDDVRVYSKTLTQQEVTDLFSDTGEEPTCESGADANSDGTVSQTELNDYAPQFYNGQITITQFSNAIIEHLQGCN